jgi:DNA repair protein SbcD/Mre11
MRILHTSDWHLGRSFHREGMLDAQSAFVDHVVDVVASEGVDLVVVSGDIFDRALPPVDAVELASEALGRLLAARIRVVLTSGNHDSAPRLGFASELIDAAGVHVRTDPRTVGTPVVIPDAHGDVAVYGLPYLEPDLVRDGWQLEGRSHQAVLDEAMRRVRDDLARRRGARSVVMAHAFVTGAAASDSERDISVGGVSHVGLATFDGVDYVALGHLHGRHTLRDDVRYSGSPLAYSFSEAAHRKGSWLVELGRDGLASAEFVDAPVPRPLAVIEGSLDALLTDRRLARHESSWVQATLTDAVRPLHALERLRQRYPHVLVVRYAPEVAATAPRAVAPAAARSAVADIEVVRRFFVDTRESEPTADELALLRDACDAARIEAATAS